MALIGIFMNFAENDPEISIRRDSFLQGLGAPSVQIAVRFGGGVTSNYAQIAHDLANLSPNPPDVLVATCWPTMNALLTETSTIPIVFTGLVNWAGEQASNYAYGTNVTGFVSHESRYCQNWIRYLLQIAPSLTRVGVIHDPSNATAAAHYQAVRNAAPHGVAVSPIDLRRTDLQLDGDLQAFANTPNGGLILLTSTLAATRRSFIIGRANHYRLPAMYPNRIYTANGYNAIDNCGLVSYGAAVSDYRNAGSCVQQILAQPRAPLPPPQINRNFELVINLNAAAAIGLNVPGGVLNQANLVIR